MIGRARLLRGIPVVLVVASLLGAAAADKPLSAGARASDASIQTSLRAGQQLAAMQVAMRGAPGFYQGYNPQCARMTPVLTYVVGQFMAGNFRDDSGGCYVWLNLAHSPLLTAPEICKLALHELGHLTGLQHSQDPNDVMYAPFQATPIPAPCTAANMRR